MKFILSGAISEKESLFVYPQGKNFSYFQRTAFVPQFDPCEDATPEMVVLARETCKGSKQCLFDFCATKDNETAAETGGTQEVFVESEETTSKLEKLISWELSQPTIQCTRTILPGLIKISLVKTKFYRSKAIA